MAPGASRLAPSTPPSQSLASPRSTPGSTTGGAPSRSTPDGKVIVAGKSNDDFLLVRFQPSGSVDSQLGFGWRGVHRHRDLLRRGKSLAAIASGKLLLADQHGRGNANFDRSLSVRRL
ncbi:MAG: delta-60 repeat domain-containing protein [Polyangiaceae bacterium]|nr:delta-60 repeat domain-containing protein [Polyangiaceae bacterium]